MHLELAAVAARNGGPFTRTQALQAGLEAAEVRSRLRSGRWTTLRRGVYVETSLLISSNTHAHRHALDVAAAILTLRQAGAVDGSDIAGAAGMAGTPETKATVEVADAAGIANSADTQETASAIGASGGASAIGAVEAAAAGAAMSTVDNPGVVGSHRSAAIIHGLELLVPPRPGVALTRPSGYVRTTPRSDVHVARLPPEHQCHRYGVALTSPARTVADLARTLPFGEGVVTTDSALRNAHTSLDDLEETLVVCAGWPGAAKAAEVVAFADPHAESAFESVSRVMFAEQRLPAPQTQVVLGDDRGPIGRVDFYWPEYRTVGEADGLSKYAGPHVLAAEKLRQERLEEAGYVVVRFTWYQVIRTPRQTAARIRTAFARGVRKR